MREIRRIIVLLLCIMLVIPIIPDYSVVYAGNGTEISVSVPAKHTVTINISGNGGVSTGDMKYRESGTVELDRLSVQTYMFEPDSGYEVVSVLYNGQEVISEVSNNRYTAPKINRDSVISVVFNKMLTKCTLSGEAGKNGWYTNNVTIIPPEGYKISRTKDGEWSDSLVITKSTDLSLYLMSKYVNVSKKIKHGKIKIDKTAPSVSGNKLGITVANNNWKSFVKSISFGIFFKASKDVKIKARDSQSGIESYRYYVSSKKLTMKKVAGLKNNKWKKGSTFSITGKDADKKIIYAKITNKAGLIKYISSDGMVFDTVAPKMSVSDGMTYYGDSLYVKVTDNDLKTVTLNGKKQKVKNGVAIVSVQVSDEEDEFEIIANDRTGNTTKSRCELLETWRRDGITKTGDYNLKQTKSYKLGKGKWTVSGDNSNYNAGIRFYVSSNKKYNIIKSE